MSTKLTIPEHLKNLDDIKRALASYHVGNFSKESTALPEALVVSRDELRAIDAVIRFAEHMYPQASALEESMLSFPLQREVFGSEVNRPKKLSARTKFHSALAGIKAWFFAEDSGLIQNLRQ